MASSSSLMEKVTNYCMADDLYSWYLLTDEERREPWVIFTYARRWPDMIYKEDRLFFHYDRDNMKKLLKTKISLFDLDRELLQDDEYMKVALSSQPSRVSELYKRNKETLRRIVDKEMALYLVRSKGGYLQYLEAFQNDTQVVLEAFKNDKQSILYTNPMLRILIENTVFEKEFDVDQMMLQISLKMIEAKEEQKKKLEDEVTFLTSKIAALTSEIEQERQQASKLFNSLINNSGQVMQENYKVKQKMPNENGTNETN